MARWVDELVDGTYEQIIRKGYIFSSRYTGSAGPVSGLDMSLSSTKITNFKLIFWLRYKSKHLIDLHISKI